MEIEASQQLKLLESEPFAGGPARPPASRRTRKPAGGTTLSLFGGPPVLEAPAPTPAPAPAPAPAVEVRPPAVPATTPTAVGEERDPRLIAIDRVIAETVARHRAARNRVPDKNDPVRDPLPPDEVQAAPTSDVPFDLRQYRFLAPPKPAERAALVTFMAEKLGGHVLRGGRFFADSGDDHLDGRVAPEGVSVTFNGATARARWAAVVKEAVQERGLSEAE